MRRNNTLVEGGRWWRADGGAQGGGGDTTLARKVSGNSIDGPSTMGWERCCFCYLARVAKYHGYGGYISVKNWKVGVKSLGEYPVLQNQVSIWVNLSNLYEILSSNHDYMIECSAFVPEKLPFLFILFIPDAKFFVIYMLFLW